MNATPTIITIEVPQELVERAKAVGVQFEKQPEQIIALLESQIEKREAAQHLRKIGEALQSLPPILKPSSQEIEAEIHQYWAEKSADDTQ
jgi:hypothetical protein